MEVDLWWKVVKLRRNVVDRNCLLLSMYSYLCISLGLFGDLFSSERITGLISVPQKGLGSLRLLESKGCCFGSIAMFDCMWKCRCSNMRNLGSASKISYSPLRCCKPPPSYSGPIVVSQWETRRHSLRPTEVHWWESLIVSVELL